MRAILGLVGPFPDPDTGRVNPKRFLRLPRRRSSIPPAMRIDQAKIDELGSRRVPGPDGWNWVPRRVHGPRSDHSSGVAVDLNAAPLLDGLAKSAETTARLARENARLRERMEELRSQHDLPPSMRRDDIERWLQE